MSKGSKRRETQVSDKQMSDNWHLAFGKPEKGCKKKQSKPKGK